MRLWEKGEKIDKTIEDFVVSDDYLLDQRLVKWDCLGSIAHIKSLQKIEILTKDEEEKIKKGLLEILELDIKGKFIIQREDEDVHTKIEGYLTEKLGDLGKKVHTARSRNEQVILAIRLYSKDFLIRSKKKCIELALSFLNFAKKNEFIPMPGRTHLQKAMPSSVGLWASSFLESILDGISIISSSYKLNDQSVLGAGASYGTPLPIDREFIREILGFERLQKNSLYVNNSRGKIESYILFSFLWTILDLSKFSTDLMLFLLPEFGYFSLADEFLLGSSLMPQKKNPSVLEMVRARSNTFISYLFQILSIINNLPSGYNQDFQETKGPFFNGCDLASSIIDAGISVVKNLKVNKDALLKGFTKEIFATDYSLKMVKKENIPFRDAYRKIAENIESLSPIDPYSLIKERRSIGGCSNLCLEETREVIESAKRDTENEERAFKERINLLVS
ncbi:MAG: argininosuccinate lyase [bacterium]